MAIEPFFLRYDGEQPTYIAVSSSDQIQIDPLTFIHFYNGSATDDTIIFRASDGDLNCQAVMLPAGEEVLLGPVEMAKYAPILIVQHSYTTSVVMAVLTTYGSFPIIELTGGVYDPYTKLSGGVYDPYTKLTGGVVNT